MLKARGSGICGLHRIDDEVQRQQSLEPSRLPPRVALKHLPSSQCRDRGCERSCAHHQIERDQQVGGPTGGTYRDPKRHGHDCQRSEHRGPAIDQHRQDDHDQQRRARESHRQQRMPMDERELRRVPDRREQQRRRDDERRQDRQRSGPLIMGEQHGGHEERNQHDPHLGHRP